MELLIIAQTLFYFTVSLAIIISGILFLYILLQLISVMRHLEHISNNLQYTTGELKEKISDILDQLERIPFLAYFFKKKKKVHKTASQK
jgi:hypothetical protein